MDLIKCFNVLIIIGGVYKSISHKRKEFAASEMNLGKILLYFLPGNGVTVLNLSPMLLIV